MKTMQGIVFDLDGVITDTAKFHFAAWSQLAQDKLGIVLPEEFEVELKGVSRIDSLKKILAFGGLEGAYTEAEIEELAAEKNGYYLKAIETLTKEDILPGITDLMAELQDHHMKIALASASKNAPAILKKLKLFDVFDAIVDPARVEHGKPAPDIFIAGATAIGLATDECVGVEDAVAGIQAIKDAGMLAVGVGDAEALQQADTVVPSTHELNYDLLADTFAKAQ